MVIWDGRSFLSHQMGISLVITHMMLYQPMEKIKNEEPHAGHMSIHDIFVMLNYVTRIFWKSFSCFSNIK